jgi:hypothetical protein
MGHGKLRANEPKLEHVINKGLLEMCSPDLKEDLSYLLLNDNNKNPKQ